MFNLLCGLRQLFYVKRVEVKGDKRTNQTQQYIMF